MDRRIVRPKVENILLTLGGTDRANRLSRLLRILDQHDLSFSITVVVGPFSPHRDRLIQTSTRCRHSVRVVESPSSLKSWMVQADLAVSAGGQTLYEMAATGTPTLAVEMFDNQAGLIAGLERYGSLRSAGRPEENGFQDRLQGMLLQLLSNSSLRQEMAEAGQRQVDGQGALRVAQEIVLKALADAS